MAAGGPSTASSRPCGVASGAVLTSGSAAAGADVSRSTCAASCVAGAVAGTGVGTATGGGNGVGGGSAGTAAVGGAAGGATTCVMAGVRCSTVASGTVILTAAGRVLTRTASTAGTGTACSCASTIFSAGACTRGTSRAATGAGTLNGACSSTVGASCAGNGTGCMSGTGGAAGTCARNALTLAGVSMRGGSTRSAMLGVITGGRVAAGTSGNASDGGGRTGCWPSSRTGRTGWG